MKQAVVVRRWVALFAIFFASNVRAETIELVTYYPSTTNAGSINSNSMAVGSLYAGVVPADGTVLIADRLGIGPGFTAFNTPSERLEVAGNILSTGPAGSDSLFIVDRANATRANGLRLSTNGTSQWTLGSRGNGTEDFHLFSNTSSTTRLFINQTFGNVGIGTTTPQQTSPTNSLSTGNLDVNDVFLRSTGQWLSQSGGGGSSFTANGYARLSGGLIVQWGTAYEFWNGSGLGWTAIPFPTAFPNACLQVIISSGDATSVYDFSKTTLRITGPYEEFPQRHWVRWIAVGY